MPRDRILQLFLKSIREQFGKHLQKIVLFGSRARKDFTPESDYDFVLIFDEVNQERKDFVENSASEILFKYGKFLSTFILSQKQFKQMQFEPFIINVKKEGIIL
ncbi:MAG: nucleotidyltransferase domain-containing protein [Elusimicrobiota bacterium]